MAISRTLGWTALLATLVVLPWVSDDPINVPKLAVISIGGFMALGILVANRAELMKRQYRLVLIFGAAFFVDLVLVLVISGTNFNQEFFGTAGRATGFVAYASLASLLIVAAVSATAAVLHKFVWYLMISGLASIVYGALQALKRDPILWTNQYSPVIGFLGNPNFQSSFVGLSGVMAFSLLIGKNLKILLRMSYLIYIIVAAFVIKETASQQGFLVLLGGIAVICFIWVTQSKFKVVTVPSFFFGLVGVVLIILGSFNKGVLASVLYKDSVTYRGDYWRAGWKMTTENPFFGVGLDSYGDWYRRSRTIEATLRRGPEVVSNAAHNVLLDLSSNGGIPLLTIYLLMMFLVALSAVRVIKRNKAFDPVFSGLVAVWIAFQAQSIISLNQLGLAVWGWVISGLIIGYEINTREVEVGQKSIQKGKNTSATVGQKVLPATTIGIFVGLLLGATMGVPSLYANLKQKSALESGVQITIQNTVNVWPRDAIRSVQIALFLENYKLNAEALKILQASKLEYPDSYDVWRALASNPSISPEELIEALAQMKRLDPLNPELK